LAADIRRWMKEVNSYYVSRFNSPDGAPPRAWESLDICNQQY
jgi:hypothetical protein